MSESRNQKVSEHGVFHGIVNLQENKSLKIKDENGLFTIE